MKAHWLYLLLRLTLGSVFLYAGILKLLDPIGFSDAIFTFKVLPASVIDIFALSLPPFEIIIGVMMIVGWRIQSAALAASILSASFIFAFAEALFRGLKIECGCFGSVTFGSVWGTLGRDAILFVGCLVIYLKELRYTLNALLL